jgi:hypothetical protein
MREAAAEANLARRHTSRVLAAGVVTSKGSPFDDDRDGAVVEAGGTTFSPRGSARAVVTSPAAPWWRNRPRAPGAEGDAVRTAPPTTRVSSPSPSRRVEDSAARPGGPGAPGARLARAPRSSNWPGTARPFSMCVGSKAPVWRSAINAVATSTATTQASPAATSQVMCPPHDARSMGFLRRATRKSATRRTAEGRGGLPRRALGSCGVEPLVQVPDDTGRHAPDVAVAERHCIVRRMRPFHSREWT